jgi:hypothetical protein
LGGIGPNALGVARGGGEGAGFLDGEEVGVHRRLWMGS